MGWETNVPAMISFSKETYSSECQVEQEIEDLKESTQESREDIMVIAMGNPKDFIVDGEDIMTVKNRVKDYLDTIEENLRKQQKLEYLLNNFKCRGGDFVDNPDYEKNIKEWLDESYINYNIEYYNKQKQEKENETNSVD